MKIEPWPEQQTVIQYFTRLRKRTIPFRRFMTQWRRTAPIQNGHHRRTPGCGFDRFGGYGQVASTVCITASHGSMPMTTAWLSGAAIAWAVVWLK